jgi:hypothetical protein
MTRPPADQPPLFDVVMGDAVPTHHRDAREHADAHARAMARVQGRLPSQQLAQVARDARLALEIGGPRLFTTPALARTLLESDPGGPLAAAAGACERERESGTRLDAIDACRAIVDALEPPR